MPGKNGSPRVSACESMMVRQVEEEASIALPARVLIDRNLPA